MHDYFFVVLLILLGTAWGVGLVLKHCVEPEPEVPMNVGHLMVPIAPMSKGIRHRSYGNSRKLTRKLTRNPKYRFGRREIRE